MDDSLEYPRRTRCTAALGLAAALLVAACLVASPSPAQQRRPVRITPGENGAVVLRVWGVGLPPAQALNAAQAEAAARNAAEIDAYSRIAYLLGRVDRSDGDRIVSSFRGRFKGSHVETSERLPDGSVHTEVTITVPAGRVPELLERIDEYIGASEAETEALRAVRAGKQQGAHDNSGGDR